MMNRKYFLDYFNTNSTELFKRYDSYNSAQLHLSWISKVPLAGVKLLEVGCGSGRDAIFFSKQAKQVTAIDFSNEMISHAKSKSSGSNIQWLVDELPELTKVTSGPFDIIIAIAVLMFLTEEEQLTALRRFRELLVKNGVVVFSIKQDQLDPLCNKLAGNFIDEAKKLGFDVEALDGGPDHNGRTGVHWQQYILRLNEE